MSDIKKAAGSGRQRARRERDIPKITRGAGIIKGRCRD